MAAWGAIPPSGDRQTLDLTLPDRSRTDGHRSFPKRTKASPLRSRGESTGAGCDTDNKFPPPFRARRTRVAFHPTRHDRREKPKAPGRRWSRYHRDAEEARPYRHAITLLLRLGECLFAER